MIDPAIASLISTILNAGLQIWATHANKPAGWTPSEQELNDILVMNEKTSESFYEEAAKRLGVEWPPPPDPT